MRISDWSSDVCSSDLRGGPAVRPRRDDQPVLHGPEPARAVGQRLAGPRRLAVRQRDHADDRMAHQCTGDDLRGGHVPPRPGPEPRPRSEEHTSELQSLMRISYAVFCLKKKKQDTNTSVT